MNPTFHTLASSAPVIDSNAFGWILLLGFIFICISAVVGYAMGYKDGNHNGYDIAAAEIDAAIEDAFEEATLCREITRAGDAALKPIPRDAASQPAAAVVANLNPLPSQP